MKRYMQILISTGLVGLVLAVTPQASVAQQRSGVEVWSQSCNRCHRPQPAARYTAGQWETIVLHMRIQARMTDGEADAVLTFLRSGARQVAQTPPDAGRVAAAGSAQTAGKDPAPAQQAQARPGGK